MKIYQAIEILNRQNQLTRVIQRDLKNPFYFGKLMDILHHPYRNFQTIHITGTNGKGSVSLKTASILQKAGYQVGLYTSPHLFSFRERIQVNSQMISQEQIAQKIILIDEIAKNQKLQLTYFEYLTAVSFLHFKEMNCDYVSLEVGLGGRNDTTNIVQPLVSVITSIGLDHTNVLGPKIQHIAWEKAGIIKNKVPVVLGPSSSLQLITGIAQEKQSQIIMVQSDKKHDFEEENKAITKQIINVLRNNYEIKISEKAIRQGITSCQPCRMQLLQKKCLPVWAQQKQIYFDVGHNPHAIVRVIEYLKKRIKVSKDKISIVFGSSQNKEIDQSLSLLEQEVGFIYLVKADHPRAMEISKFKQWIGFSSCPQKYRVIEDGNIQKTLYHVVADPNNEVVLICGSFFMMKESKGFFISELKNPQVDENISECSQLTQEIKNF